MAQDNKFGTFGGVFTPSILTILGVIMYLRLPWVVGNAGLYVALGVVGVSHVISICTGLSISSIATDKKVGAGGPYYIVSRSLGLPIGGTLGLALFLGLAFSISLYVIGFSESFLAYWGIAVTPTNIRICGTATLTLLTVVTLISTAVAIKTQYIIMVLIALSLVSIALGSTPASDSFEPLLKPAEGGESLALIFGIFFPAVTGFTAGVNMSGDLRDPTTAIPRGTMAAIAVGLVVYVVLAIFLAYRVPADQLANDPEIFLKISLSPQAVVGGIWGATLSSALGSIMGAPRVLQAVAGDRIGPKWFAKGYGPSNEPRNALLLAFAIGEAGILIAELNAIARIVSMVFLTTYGFLNMSCAIESWVSPDFRPQFKIPNMVSVVGAVTCVLIMIQLDLLAMMGAVVFMGGLFLLLSRRQLTLDAGDAWEGIWSSLVRSGLFRLSRERRQQRNWRPNILLFRPPDPGLRDALRGVASSLIAGNGILSELELDDGDAPEGAQKDADDLLVGIFTERIPKRDVYDTIADVCRYRGFTGLQPNTVLLDWRCYREDEERFGELLDVITQLDHNLLLYARGDESSADSGIKRRVDVWWRPYAGNAPLCLALVRFLTRDREYQDAAVRFMLLSNDSSSNDHLRSTMRGLLVGSRVDADIRIINNTLRSGSFAAQVASESTDAELTIIGLPNDPDECDPEYQHDIDDMLAEVPRLLLVRASSSFEEVLTLSRQATISFLPPASLDGTPDDLPTVDLPETRDVAKAVSRLADGYQRLVSRFQKSCVQQVYGREIKLVRAIQKALDKHFGQLQKGLVGANPRRQRNLLNRLQSSLLLECERILNEFAEQGLPEQRSTLEGRIEAFLEAEDVVDRSDKPRALSVQRARADFEVTGSDGAELRSIKRSKRFWAVLLRREHVRYKVPIAKFQAYYFEKAVSELLHDTLRQFVTDSHHLMVHLGKTLSSPKMGLALPGEDELPPVSLRSGSGSGDSIAPDDDELLEAITEQKNALAESLEELVRFNKERLTRHQWSLLAESRRLVQAYCSDIDRIDASQLARAKRRVNVKAARQQRAAVKELPASWATNQQLIVERAALGLKLSSFQHRLSSAIEREKQSMLLSIRNGALGECEHLLAALERFSELLRKLPKDTVDKNNPGLGTIKHLRNGLDVRLDLGRRFDPEQVMENLVQSTTDLASELPQWANTLSDQSIQRLEEGSSEEIETVEVPVFRLAQFLVEAKLMGSLQAELEKIPQLEERASGVAQDVMRLVAFQLNELESAGVEEPEIFGSQIVPVVDKSLERVEAEIEALRGALGAVAGVIEQQLQAVIDGTNAYDLSSTSADLEQHIRRHHGKRAVSGARSMIRRGSETVKDAMVNLLYRRSAGVLMARERRARTGKRGRRMFDGTLGLVEQHMPRADLLDQLPFYYRQLFVGQATVNETFWVGREKQLAEAKRAIGGFNRGGSGAVVVVGERASGKSSLVQRITTELLGKRQLHRVFAPRGGSIDPADFAAALRKTTGGTGDCRELLGQLPDGSVVVVDDLELWWERGDGGGGVLDLVLDLVEATGDRVLFVLALSSQAFAFINRFRPIADDALTVLECGPLPAEVLKSIIMLRHGSTGMKFELGDKSEDSLTEWTFARLFSSHFDYSRGYVGAALRSWITHIRKVSESTIVVDAPTIHSWDVVDELRPEWVALLLQLVLHKQLTRARLVRITGLDAHTIDHQIDTLIRMGLVEQNQRGAIDVNGYIHHMLLDRFTRRGLIV